MEIQLKQRVIGAVVIFTILIIFLPIVFQDDSNQQYVEQILEPPISNKKLATIQAEKRVTEEFMSDSLDNIVLDENSSKLNANEQVKVGKIEMAAPANSVITGTKETEVKADSDDASLESDFGNQTQSEQADATSNKINDNSVRNDLKPIVKHTTSASKATFTISKDRSPNEVYAIKLSNYPNKAQALSAKQKLQSIGFPAYIAQLDKAYNLYVGPELETKYIKALARRIAEETEFTPQIVVHNSSWKTE